MARFVNDLGRSSRIEDTIFYPFRSNVRKPDRIDLIHLDLNAVIVNTTEMSDNSKTIINL